MLNRPVEFVTASMLSLSYLGSRPTFSFRTFRFRTVYVFPDCSLVFPPPDLLFAGFT